MFSASVKNERKLIVGSHCRSSNCNCPKVSDLCNFKKQKHARMTKICELRDGIFRHWVVKRLIKRKCAPKGGGGCINWVFSRG